MGLIERVGQFLRRTNSQVPEAEAVNDWSLGKYKTSVEAQIAAKEALQVQQEAERVATFQRQAVEQKVATVLTQSRRNQAETFREESGIGILISGLEETIERDLSKQWPKGRLRLLPREEQAYCGEGEPTPLSDIEEVGFRILRTQQISHDKDSILDAVIWWDGEKKVIGTTANSATEHKYIKYSMIEVTPDGDVVFHSKTRNSVTVDLWRRDKGCLEIALGKAFNNPAIYPRENTYGTWSHGPQTHIG